MRIGSLFVIVSGLFTAALIFLQLSATSLPYPDATPEILEKQASQIQFWNVLLLLSLVIVAISGLALWRTYHKK
jgi:hypothetical protein